MRSFTFNLNGQPVSVQAHDEMPLLWLLRDVLGLTGTKYGCGVQLCGACTVHVQGEATRSCGITMAQLDGRDVTTIEGLGRGSLKVLQRAWIEEDVPQCGYCQSGQLMSAAALLTRTQQPSDAEVSEALRGNLCRCGTYPRIQRAIQRAASELRHAAAADLDPSDAGPHEKTQERTDAGSSQR